MDYNDIDQFNKGNEFPELPSETVIPAEVNMPPDMPRETMEGVRAREAVERELEFRHFIEGIDGKKASGSNEDDGNGGSRLFKRIPLKRWFVPLAAVCATALLIAAANGFDPVGNNMLISPAPSVSAPAARTTVTWPSRRI